MPITYDRIGNETFLRIDGHPDTRQRMLDEVTRPGVDGVAFRQMGRRGKPFSLHCLKDFTSANLAQTVLGVTYKGMVGTNVNLLMRGISWANYLVLDVTPVSLQQMANAVGGTMGGTWLLETEWSLVYSAAT